MTYGDRDRYRRGRMYDDDDQERRFGEQSSYGRDYGYQRDDDEWFNREGREGWRRDNSRQQNYGQSRFDRERSMYGQSDYGRRQNYGRDAGDYDREGYGQSRFDRERSMYGQPDDGRRQNYGQARYGGQPTTWTYTEVWLIPGPQTGRGPRGYQRSDERIKEEVCERLTQHGDLDARDIEVNVDNGEVTLRGMVDSREAKRMAEDAAEGVSGAKDIHNQLRIKQDQDAQQGQDQQKAQQPQLQERSRGA